ncbi:Pycsar system effector family protein [Streptomyces globisporus]|uniref:Pycsar system effector family protein n=1 Tax=Streptomyces globisporus TaxID=1908 RepID=UPI0036FB267F
MSPEAIETAWRIHGAIGEWTARVDAKASFALTLESAATAGIIALSADDQMFSDLYGWGVRAPLWLGTMLILAGGIFATLVVVPRLRASRDLETEAPSHFIYFGHLRHREPAELATALQQTDVLPVLSSCCRFDRERWASNGSLVRVTEAGCGHEGRASW